MCIAIHASLLSCPPFSLCLPLCSPVPPVSVCAPPSALCVPSYSACLCCAPCCHWTSRAGLRKVRVLIGGSRFTCVSSFCSRAKLFTNMFMFSSLTASHHALECCTLSLHHPNTRAVTHTACRQSGIIPHILVSPLLSPLPLCAALPVSSHLASLLVNGLSHAHATGPVKTLDACADSSGHDGHGTTGKRVQGLVGGSDRLALLICHHCWGVGTIIFVIIGVGK